MENEQLVQFESGGLEIRMSRSPETVLAEAKLCAKSLGRMVEQTKAFTIVGGRKHLHFTAWQTLGSMFRITPRVREMKFVDYGGVKGFECIAEAFHVPSGQVVSVAESQCMNDEPNWSVRPSKNGEQIVPMFQLRSMAQTRACAKALRNVLAWVVVLAGYEATPAEEMTGHEHGDTPIQEPQKKAPNGDCISENQGKRMYAIAKQAGLPNDEYRAFLKKHGFEQTTDVKKASYDAMVEELTKMGAPA